MSFNFLFILLAVAMAAGSPRPKDIVDLKSIDPTIAVNMAYFSDTNFVGRKISGYKANICYLTIEAAQALKKVQSRLKEKNAGLTLLTYDCYRPQKAVAHFIRWANDAEDTTTQTMFYPGLSKEDLIGKGYIAAKSDHSRAGTVDLTIASVRGDETIPIEMGGTFDYFDEKSHYNYRALSKEAKNNRKMLVDIMAPEFAPYAKEWWHFTFKSKVPKAPMDFDIAP